MEKIIFRSFKEGDYETCCKWWDWWWQGEIPVKRELLPHDSTCFIIENEDTPIVAGFLYQTNSSVVIFDWVVSNPKYRDSDRGEAIELLIKESEKTCKKLGYRHIFSWARNKKLVDTHRKLGWNVDKKPSNELIKNL